METGEGRCKHRVSLINKETGEYECGECGNVTSQTGEAQWSIELNQLMLKSWKQGLWHSEAEFSRDVKSFITQTLENLGRELAEKADYKHIYPATLGRDANVNLRAVTTEDIYSVFKKYGLDIGGKGKEL